jgi:hypothetical protein
MKLNLRGDISLKLKQIVAYANDVALVVRSPKALKEIFHKLQNEGTLVGLNINEDNQIYANKGNRKKGHNTHKV